MPETAVPRDLQIEPHDGPGEANAFAALPIPHQREYVDRILEARRPVTRARRTEQTVERAKTRPRG